MISSLERNPSREVTARPDARALSPRKARGADPTPPPMSRILSPLRVKPFPKGPLRPTLLPAPISKRASVAWPTDWTVMQSGPEKLMGISSTPLIQSMRYWPGLGLRSLSRRKVRISLASDRTSSIMLLMGLNAASSRPDHRDLPGSLIFSPDNFAGQERSSQRCRIPPAVPFPPGPPSLRP